MQAALDDLSRILEIWDITPHQKAEARLERAAIMRHLKRWDEARTDLEAVLASKYLSKVGGRSHLWTWLMCREGQAITPEQIAC